MSKPIKAVIKLNIPAGKATPAPPVGPALGQHGVAIMDFCKQFNAQTQDKGEALIPVAINVYEDRSFDFVTKTSPASYLLKKAAGIEKGSGAAPREKLGKVTSEQIKKIAQEKMPDLNTRDIEKAIKIIEGTAKQMGIAINTSD